jgi:uncharacterized protein YraI
MKYFYFIAVALFLLLTNSTVVVAGQVVAVNSPRDGFLALRSDPSAKVGSRLDKVPHGTELHLSQCVKTESDIPWCKTVFNGKEGWVFSKYVIIKVAQNPPQSNEAQAIKQPVQPSGSSSSSSVNNPKHAEYESKAAFVFEKDAQIQIGLGMLGSTQADPLLPKRLGMSKGKLIVIKSYWLMSRDESDWNSGGKLYLYNDYSMGKPYTIQCNVSPEQGDMIVKDGKRRELYMVGIIKEFTSEWGLALDPCQVEF